MSYVGKMEHQMVTEDALKIGKMHQITAVGLILIELFLVENMFPTVRFRPSWAHPERRHWRKTV